jgi:negative regulator of sigma E activity
VPWLVRQVRRWVERVPDLAVGASVVLAFLGVRSLLSGLSGHAPAQDAPVLVLSLAMTALVVLLCAITATRARR